MFILDCIAKYKQTQNSPVIAPVQSSESGDVRLLVLASDKNKHNSIRKCEHREQGSN